jgi:hypothetical protein
METVDSLSAAEHANAPAPAKDATMPLLVVDDTHLTITAEKLRDLFAASGKIFDRVVPVEIAIPNRPGGNRIATTPPLQGQWQGPAQLPQCLGQQRARAIGVLPPGRGRQPHHS